MSVDDRVMFSTLDLQFDWLLILYSQSSFLIFNICTLSSPTKFIRLTPTWWKLECRLYLTLWKHCSRGFGSWKFPGTTETQATGINVPISWHLVKHCWTDMFWRRRGMLRLWMMMMFSFVFWLWCLLSCSNKQHWIDKPPNSANYSAFGVFLSLFLLSYPFLSFCQGTSTSELYQTSESRVDDM